MRRAHVLTLLTILALLAPAVLMARSQVIVQRMPTTAPVSGCGSALIASDTFTEASTGNIALNTHTKTSGGSWTTGGGTSGINDLSLDRANDVALSTASGANGAGGVIDDSVGCYDYSIQSLVRTGGTGSNRVGVLGRYDLAAGNGYWLRITGGGELSLYEDVAGSAANLISSTTVAGVVGSFAVGTNYTLRLDMKGTQLLSYINDTQAFASTNATYTTGKPGIKITNTSSRADTFTSSFIP